MNKKIYHSILWGGVTLLLLPFLIMFLWMFTKRWEWPYLLPQAWGMRAINHILDPTNKVFLTVLKSIGLSATVTCLTLLITLPAVKALTFYPIKFKKLWYLLIWAPLIVPTSTIGMGIHKQMIAMGLANSWIGVIIVQLIPCVPYAMLMLQEVYELIGEKLELQARMLGANGWKTLRYITIPLMMPAIVVASVFIFTVSFGQYFLTFLIGGGTVTTLPIIMFPYVEQGDRMLSSVYSFVFIATIFLCIHLFEIMMKRYYKF